MGVLIVFSTFPDEASARAAADSLVESRLAACASILPGIDSIYRWQGRIEVSSEVMLVIKTTQEAYPQLEPALKACHPYELPEILAVRAEAGLPGYLEWVAQETARNNK
ncbi:MAG: divalent-cation tolerance protein CutA [Pseudomonadota bacterium]